MTRNNARQLILVLLAHRIPFTVSRDVTGYVIGFQQSYVRIVQQAIGA